MADRLNRYSSRITQPKSQGASQAMLHGTGLSREDMDKAEVGISSVWYEGNTCNMHLNDLAARVREGVQAADLVGVPLDTSLAPANMNFMLVDCGAQVLIVQGKYRRHGRTMGMTASWKKAVVYLKPDYHIDLF